VSADPVLTPVLKGYPRPDEEKVEDLPSEWSKEDREIEDRKPDLGETEEDTSAV
jgi:hypothetical protein